MEIFKDLEGISNIQMKKVSISRTENGTTAVCQFLQIECEINTEQLVHDSKTSKNRKTSPLSISFPLDPVSNLRRSEQKDESLPLFAFLPVQNLGFQFVCIQIGML